ncbi:hypothetical protein EON63_21185 [archaeon]|nr:MAG: hypothetical protein EON63_21185 [archaeon]
MSLLMDMGVVFEFVCIMCGGDYKSVHGYTYVYIHTTFTSIHNTIHTHLVTGRGLCAGDLRRPYRVQQR